MALFKSKIEIDREAEADKIKAMTVIVGFFMERQHAEWGEKNRDYDCSGLLAGVKFDVAVYVENNIVTWKAKTRTYQWRYIPRQGTAPADLIELPEKK